MKILVALSGGIDSSVTAHLLKEQGHELIGVMMKLWVDPLAPEVRSQLPSKCCSIEHIERARQVCATLDIPFYILNIEEEFKSHVVDPFLEAHKEGKTPNPCIYCNREVKFGKLLEKMHELGCEKLATGHYVQTKEVKGEIELHQAADESKDQSYYLYSLGSEALQDILFPLGGMQKSDVYELAKKYNVPLRDDYHESQDLCFFPEREPTAFLKRYLNETIAPGEIRTEDGTVVGTHQGLPFYTTGQRKGLGIGGLRIPLHVTRKDVSSNTLFVAESGKDCCSALKATNLYWLDTSIDRKNAHAMTARISSLGKKYNVTFSHDDNICSCRFDEPVRGIAAGQSIVFYEGTRVVGGGEIL